MSEILDRLEAAGADLVEEAAGAGLDDLLLRANELVDEHVEGDMRGHAIKGLEALREVRQPALRLGKAGLAWIVGLLENGQREAARRLYVATAATYAERRAYMQAAGDRAEVVAREAQESWNALYAGLMKIGEIALKALGLVLLGAIGA